MDYSTEVPSVRKVLTLLLVVGAVSCSPLPGDPPSSRPTSPPATHLVPPVHSVEVSHEIRKVTFEVNVNEGALDPNITPVQDAADSTPDQELPLPRENPTSPYTIRHLGFTPAGYVDTLHPVYVHATPPKIIEAKDNVRNKKQDDEVDASIPKPVYISSDTISSHESEGSNNFPQPKGEPEEYIGLEHDGFQKDMPDPISVISQPIKDNDDQAKNAWEPIQDNISKNIDDAVKSINNVKNEAQRILNPIQDEISKNFGETIDSINEASEAMTKDNTVKVIIDATNEAREIFDPIKAGISDSINEDIVNDERLKSSDAVNNDNFESASESMKNDVDYKNNAPKSIDSGEQNDLIAANSELDDTKNINQDFKRIKEKAEAIETDYDLIDGAVEFIKDETHSVSDASREVFGNVMHAALKADPEFNSNVNLNEEFGITHETEINNKDEKFSEHNLESVSLNDEIVLEDSHIEAITNDDTTESTLSFTNLPQSDQPALDVDQNQIHKLKEETLKSSVKETSEKELAEEMPQPVQPFENKDKEDNMFIDAVKRSDAFSENSEFPQEDESIGGVNPNESPRNSRVYIEEIHGIPEEKTLAQDDPPIVISEDHVEDIPELNEEDSIPESTFSSPISDDYHEEEYSNEEDFSKTDSDLEDYHGDAEITTDSPSESVENESDISPDISIDITQNERIPKVEENIPMMENEPTLDNNEDQKETPEEIIEDVQSSGDEHIDEEVPELNDDYSINEPEEPLDIPTAGPSAAVPTASEDSPDEYMDSVIKHESSEEDTSPPKGNSSPKAESSDQVHPHKLSSSDSEVSVPRYLPPEQVSIAAPDTLTAGSIVGIVFGVLLSLSVLIGGLGFMIYQRRGTNRPKSLNSNSGYAGSDSGGYIDDDQVRVSYVNSQTDMPKGKSIRDKCEGVRIRMKSFEEM